MGEYIFSVYAKWQLGFNIQFNGQIVLSIPFLDFRLSISKYAKGVEILGIYF